MKKYYIKMMLIIIIMMSFFLLLTYWFNLNIGYGHIFLIIGGLYGIYLNFKALVNERKQL